MPTLKELNKKKRTAKPDAPFGRPSSDEIFELLIPEGAESGKIPAGTYPGKLIGITKDVSKSSGNPMWTFVFTITEGPYTAFDFNLWASLNTNALWKMADTLRAIGIEYTPGTRFKFALKDVLGTLVRLVIVDDKDNNGRDVSKLGTVLPAEDDEIGTKSTRAGKVPRRAVEEDEENESETEDEEEEPTPRRKKSRVVEEEEEDEEEPAPKRRKKVVEEEEEEEEEDWPEPPASKGKKKAVEEEEEEEDEEDEEPVRKSAKGGKRRSRL